MRNKTKKYLLMSFVSILLLIAAYSGGVSVQAETQPICPYIKGDNLIYDPSFEIKGSVEFTDHREISSEWKSVSWAGTDKDGWGHDSTNNNAYMICSHGDLPAGETPTVYQDVTVEKNSYYVLSFYVRAFGSDEQLSDLVAAARDPLGNDPWINIQQYSCGKAVDEWQYRYVVIYSGSYQTLRIALFTTSVAYGGTLSGYHIDDVALHKAASPVEADFDVPTTVRVGELASLSLKAKFTDQIAFCKIQPNAFVTTSVTTSDSNIAYGDGKGNIFAVGVGQVDISLTINIFGKTFDVGKKRIDVLPQSGDRAITSVEVRADNVDFTDLSPLDVSVFLSDGTMIGYDEYSVEYYSTNPKAVCIRNFNGVSYATAIGNGDAEIVAEVTSRYGKAVGKTLVSVKTDNYLVDPGFEAQYDYRFWKTEGLAGCNVDDGKTNIYMRSGHANFWLMAPVWWDAGVKPDSMARISQQVRLQSGKYALEAYIRRYSATGVDGLLSGQGGIVTMGVVKLDKNMNETNVVYSREFDTSYGTGNDYGKISAVFQIEEGDYLVFFRVDGDPTYGLGMQLDDMSLTEAKYPDKITATINVDKMNVDDIYKIDVWAHYADGTKEKITEDLRYFFDDYYVACESAGFVVAKKGGTAEMKIVATVLDKKYDTSLKIVVDGTTENSKSQTPWYLIPVAIGGVAVVAAVVAVAVIVVKRKKGGVA